MEVPAIQLFQAGVEMYIGSFTSQQVRDLRSKNRLRIDQFNPETKEGYQRVINRQRVREIADFLSKPTKHVILAPLLPTAVVINCRTKHGLHFDQARNRLIISDSAELHVIDGQHRVEGIVASGVRKYDLPVTFLHSMNVAQEAAQFLTINTKQKKVRPDLQLRVLYHMDRRQTRRLIDALSVENWKLEAVHLVIALNDRNESPWRNLIRRPGEKARRWIPMTESNFEDTLRFFCGSDSPIRGVPTDAKEQFLLEFWEAIRQVYADGFRDPDGKSYSICRSHGTGILNTLAPVAYGLREAGIMEPTELASSIARAFPLTKWRRTTGEIGRMGTSQKMYREQAERFMRRIESRLDYADWKEFTRISRRRMPRSHLSTLEKAMRMLSPLYPRPTNGLGRSEPLHNRSCYVLWRSVGSRSRVYVGRAVNARRRLKQHNRFDLYHVRACSSDREMEMLEQALYHLVKPAMRDNANHPPKAGDCPFC